MKHFTDVIVAIFLLFTWLAGIVIANGFWQTLAACFPFYAWYLVIEKAMRHSGFI